MTIRSLTCLAATLLILSSSTRAGESKLWQQFVEAKKAGAAPVLNDFSFAGYHGSVDPISDVRDPIFDATKFGAIPDDGKDDQDAIQKTIDAAEAGGGGVVLLPAGTLHVNTDMSRRRPITIKSGHVVLRGRGAGVGGTVIFIDQPTVVIKEKPIDTENDEPATNATTAPVRNQAAETEPTWMVNIQPPKEASGELLAKITSDCPREGFSFNVDDPSKIKPGQWVTLSVKGKDFINDFLAPYKLDDTPSKWTGIRGAITLVERHLVQSVDGGRVTLREPTKAGIQAKYGWTVNSFPNIAEVGVEDICFTGAWLGHFNHHRSHMDDEGWCGVKMFNVTDSWIRRCAFINLNQSMGFESCAYTSTIQCVLGGTMGHHSINEPRRSSGMLYGLTLDCMEQTGRDTTHGIGAAGQSNGIVYWRYTMQKDQSFDMHGRYPYATLFDAVTGGNMASSGGPEGAFPNHLRDFVAWNFEHTRPIPKRGKSPGTYNFWSGSRPTLVMPILVGMHGVEVPVDEKTVSVNESWGKPVEPESLFEAQLALRFDGKLPAWVNEAKADWAKMQKSLPPYPRGGDNTPFVAQKREQIIRQTMATPMVKDRFDKTDPLGALVKEWPTSDGSPWPPFIDVQKTKARIIEGKDETVHYTLDGAEPTEQSPTYSEPIELPSGATLKAVAFKPGQKPSAISAAERK